MLSQIYFLPTIVGTRIIRVYNKVCPKINY